MESYSEQVNLIVSQVGGLYLPRGITASPLLCTVPTPINLSFYYGLNNTSSPTGWFVFQLAQPFHKARTFQLARSSTNRYLNSSRWHRDQ